MPAYLDQEEHVHELAQCSWLPRLLAGSGLFEVYDQENCCSFNEGICLLCCYKSLNSQLRSLRRGCLWWVAPPCSTWIYLSRGSTGRSYTRPRGPWLDALWAFYPFQLNRVWVLLYIIQLALKPIGLWSVIQYAVPLALKHQLAIFHFPVMHIFSFLCRIAQIQPSPTGEPYGSKIGICVLCLHCLALSISLSQWPAQ